MLDLGLEVERESSIALDLIRHKNWLVHKQTACGKDFSNPFMVDNLPKIVGFSTHLASLVKSWLVQDQTVLALASPKANELTIPEQTATGKGTSNPLMAEIYSVWDSHLGTTSGGGPRRQETIRDTIAQARFENVSKHSNDPLFAREKAKTIQAEEIVSLKRRVKKLEQKKRSRTHRLKRLYKGRINAIDADEDITLVNDQDDVDMFDVNTLTALAALKSVKPKVKSNVVEDPSVPVSATSTKVSAATTTTTATIPTPRKGIVNTELEPKKPLKKKDQISSNKQEAIRLQAEFDEEDRLARDKDKANVALTKE
ncbi:hypothetical protein Tco_1176881 [Tanacetum coccineum]